MEKVDILFRDEKKLKKNIEELTVEDHYLLKKLIKLLRINIKFNKEIYENKREYKYRIAQRIERTTPLLKKILEKIYKKNIDINILTEYYLEFWLQNWFMGVPELDSGLPEKIIIEDINLGMFKGLVKRDIINGKKNKEIIEHRKKIFFPNQRRPKFIGNVDYNIHKIKIKYNQSDYYKSSILPSPYCDCNMLAMDNYIGAGPLICFHHRHEEFRKMYINHYDNHKEFYIYLYNGKYRTLFRDFLIGKNNFENLKLLLEYGLNINNLILDRFSEVIIPSIDFIALIFYNLDIEIIAKRNQFDFLEIYRNYSRYIIYAKSKRSKIVINNIFYELNKILEKYSISLNKKIIL